MFLKLALKKIILLHTTQIAQIFFHNTSVCYVTDPSSYHWLWIWLAVQLLLLYGSSFFLFLRYFLRFVICSFTTGFLKNMYRVCNMLYILSLGSHTFHNFRKFSSILSLNNLFPLFFLFSPAGTLITHMLEFPMLSYFLHLCSFTLFFHILSCCHSFLGLFSFLVLFSCTILLYVHLLNFVFLWF